MIGRDAVEQLEALDELSEGRCSWHVNFDLKLQRARRVGVVLPAREATSDARLLAPLR